MVVVYIILALVSPGLLAILTYFLLQWKKTLPGGREVAKLREELESMRRDYAQLKAEHTDMLLGLERATRRLEKRLDQFTGIDAPAPEPPRREPPQRQL